MPRRVVLAVASEPQEIILNAALGAQGLAVEVLPPGGHLESAALQAARGAGADGAPLLLIDVVALAQLATSADNFCHWTREHCAGAELLLYCSGLHAVTAQARVWARRLGARDLLPGCDIAHWRHSLLPTLNAVQAALGDGAADERATARALRELPALLDRSTQVAHAWHQCDLLQAIGMTPQALAAAIADSASGVNIAPRRYRAKTYDECFIGSDAVECLTRIAKAAGAPHQRADVLPLGQALLDLGFSIT